MQNDLHISRIQYRGYPSLWVFFRVVSSAVDFTDESSDEKTHGLRIGGLTYKALVIEFLRSSLLVVSPISLLGNRGGSGLNVTTGLSTLANLLN